MRPPEFTGGNPYRRGHVAGRLAASMRPPEFTGGNSSNTSLMPPTKEIASMRPPEFTGGNPRRHESHNRA